jgi:curved DNA-binding protein CbpA
MTGRNPWAVLCVAEGAPYQEIQRAFRRRVKETHPDSGGEASEFATVVEAFDVVRRSTPSRHHRRSARPPPYAH